jgi:hypothetical protein
MVNIEEVFAGKTSVHVADDDSDLRLTLCEYLVMPPVPTGWRHLCYQGRSLIQNIDIVRFLTDRRLPAVGKMTQIRPLVSNNRLLKIVNSAEFCRKLLVCLARPVWHSACLYRNREWSNPKGGTSV